MQTNKEAILAALRGEKVDFIPEFYTSVKDLPFPAERYVDFKGNDPYGTGPDAWGVMWTLMGPNPLVDGNTVAKDFKLFDEMDQWKEKVKFPKIKPFMYKIIFKKMQEEMGVDRNQHAVSCLLLSGQFERMNQMIGMENALCAFYEYPDEVHEFFDAMCEYKLKCIELVHKLVKPDIIHMHDDWGTDKNMFFSPEIWREFIKPNEAKYAKRIHELGMIYMHHSCGYIQQIIPDLVEIGVDAINPMMVMNDIDYILENYGDKITVVGGIDNQFIDTPGTTEEQIRAEIRSRIDRYANKGRYIPFVIPNDVQKFEIFKDEASKYGREIVLKK